MASGQGDLPGTGKSPVEVRKERDEVFAAIATFAQVSVRGVANVAKDLSKKDFQALEAQIAVCARVAREAQNVIRVLAAMG